MNSVTTETKPEAPPAETKTPAPMVVAGDDPSRVVSAFASEQAYNIGVRMARSLSRSSLMPKAYQGDENVPNVMIAMELANRIGASVFMVAQNLDVVHGRPSWRSQFLIATVNASRRFTPLRFRFQGTEGQDDWGCRAVAKDTASGDECIGALITIRLAKAEQWYQRSGSKWQTMPEQMMMYRAAAFWTRVYCPELALGIHTSEEAQDMTIDVEPLPNGSNADLEAKLRATPIAGAGVAKKETPKPKAVASEPIREGDAQQAPPKTPPRDFRGELNAMRADLAKRYDESDNGDGTFDAAARATMRAEFEAFCADADAPADVVKDARKFWAFLTGERQ